MSTPSEQREDPAERSRRTTRERAEQQRIEQHAALSPEIIHEAIRQEGEDELRHPSFAVAWSGLAAGLSMGFSLVAEGLLRAHLPDASWSPLISKLGYSVGFVIVILARHQLYTENTLTLFFPVVTAPDRHRVGHALRLASIVLIANLLGALAFAWVVGRTAVFEPEIRRTFQEIGLEAIRGDFGTILLRSIFAGWLIALMGWVLPFAESARVLVIVILAYLVGLSELSHIIAGSVETLYLVVTGTASWQDYLRWMFPTLLGNTLGGVILAAALNHGQVLSPSRCTEE